MQGSRQKITAAPELSAMSRAYFCVKDFIRKGIQAGASASIWVVPQEFMLLPHSGARVFFNIFIGEKTYGMDRT